MQIISLGTVEFSDTVEKSLYIEEEHQWFPVGQSIRYTLFGTPIITENPRSGKPLTLIAKEDDAWLTKATVLLLSNLATQINTTYDLVMKNDFGVNETRRVMFKRDSNPLDLQPLDTAQRYFVGAIHLIEV